MPPSFFNNINCFKLSFQQLSMAELPNVYVDRMIIGKHKSYGMYHPAVFHLSQVVWDFPLIFLQVCFNVFNACDKSYNISIVTESFVQCCGILDVWTGPCGKQVLHFLVPHNVDCHGYCSDV